MNAHLFTMGFCKQKYLLKLSQLHRIAQMDYMQFGVNQARRGWLEKMMWSIHAALLN
jgi:hypothetical protein